MNPPAATHRSRSTLWSWSSRAPIDEPKLWLLWCALVVSVGAGAFLLPALERTGGIWPAPLDDVYIYFGFARSLALGHGLSWVPGNGYSSGATSALYPVLLAPGWLLGLRGTWLGVWASLLAVVLLVDLSRSLRAIVDFRPIAYLVPLVVVSVPLLDWSWFSGMETALFGAVLGRVLLGVSRCRSSPPTRRAARQLGAGGWLALLFLVRPEAVVLALPLAFVVTWNARSLTTAGSLARSLGPLLLTAALQSSCNRLLTGEWAPAGAIRKLITSNPHLDSTTVALEVLKNLLVLEHQAVDRALGPAPLGLLVPLLALGAVLLRRHRGLGASLLLGAVAVLFAVSLNNTARFQNYRYAAPTLVMLLAGACLGLDSLASAVVRTRLGPRSRRLGLGAIAAVAVLGVVAPLGELRGQIDHFARSSRNIAEQQVEVGRRLRQWLPVPRRVLVGDAGAIAYLSELPALDGLGLGGLRDLPFARASVHGVPAVIELIERLPTEERPDLFAIYPSWWPELADRFGARLDSVRIDDNVICAAEEKVIYGANWELLGPAVPPDEATIDVIDVADLVDERAHDYSLPSPQGGWLTAEVHPLPESEPPKPRWDGGRIAPEGSVEQLTVRRGIPRAAASLVMRTDPATRARLRVVVVRDGHSIQHEAVVVDSPVPPTPPSSELGGCTGAPSAPSPNPMVDDRWREIVVALSSVGAGDRIRIEVEAGTWRSYHLWLRSR